MLPAFAGTPECRTIGALPICMEPGDAGYTTLGGGFAIGGPEYRTFGGELLLFRVLSLLTTPLFSSFFRCFSRSSFILLYSTSVSLSPPFHTRRSKIKLHGGPG